MSSLAPRRALFLDRDGVINHDTGYVGRIADMRFMPGIFDLVGLARAHHLAVVVVTNQSGIARGLFSEDDYAELTRWMLARFAERDAAIDRVYHCPHHPDASVARYRADHPWRKPAPGMLLQAAADIGLDLAASALIGDKPSDMQAGAAAGIGLRVLIGDATGVGQPDGIVPAGSVGDAIDILRDWLRQSPDCTSQSGKAEP
ncbi:MAG: HAD family hydrolase [Proteobacteria bacterium]|nr:HAD family hydrolase [Pseudomonadota bacterium]